MSLYLRLILLLNISAVTANVFISLGDDCQAAYYLRKFKLRNEAFPFDWVKSPNFDAVCQLIENNFENFLHPQYLTRKNFHVEHEQYKIIFLNDFHTRSLPDLVGIEPEQQSIDYHVYIDEVQAKYQRRIERFVTVLQSQDFIYFIRTNATYTEAKIFVECMLKNYPECTFILIVVNAHDPFFQSWDLTHVRNFYAQQRVPAMHNWWHESEWRKIFKELGVLD